MTKHSQCATSILSFENLSIIFISLRLKCLVMTLGAECMRVDRLTVVENVPSLIFLLKSDAESLVRRPFSLDFIRFSQSFVCLPVTL